MFVLLVAAAKILAVKVHTLTQHTCLVLVDSLLTQPAYLGLSMYLLLSLLLE